MRMKQAPETTTHRRPDTGGSAGVTVIEPTRGGSVLRLAELWRYRELGQVLTWRDLRVRYKQTLLGASWAILQPLGMMVVATIVFGKLLGLASAIDGPYPVYVYAGMVPWTLFAASVTAASNSLVNSAEMIRKIYFPRLIVPLSAVGAPLVDFAIAFGVLFGLMVWFGCAFNVSLLLLPLIVVSVVIAALGVGVMLAALTVTYRDFRLVVPFMLQLWFFFVPVIYKLPVSSKWTAVLSLNPMYGPVQAVQQAVQGQAIDTTSWLTSTLVAVLMLVIGLRYFAQTERRFADLV
jgi:lipopolysaccharide transport system permease protein